MAEKGVRVRIISESVGKGFKDAQKALSGLNKAAGLLGVSLSAAAVVKFGKDAAKAFIADEKAASQLAMSVKNLGLAFETPRIEEFISQLSKASGVTDDQLRPAMQKLLQTTGSVKKSTELLTQALDISRGSGVDYETVISDLSAAYLGQTKGLTKYSLGLTKAELKTMSFADIQKKLTDQFKGGNAAYLETYAGKMQVLATAAGEAQETIGKGLVNSLSILAGDGNTVQPLADSMQELATYIGEVLTGLATMIAEFKKLPGVQKYVEDIFPFLAKNSLIGQTLDFVRKFSPTTTPGMGGYPSSALGPGYIDPNDAARKKAEAEALKRAKALAALQAKTLADAKKKTALEKAAKTLELERINIAAALKGQISETDRLSLNLQLALLDKNDAAATKLSGELTEAVKRQNALNAALLATPEAPNPYRNWKVPEMGPFAMPGTVTGQGYGQLVPNFNVPDYAKDSYSQLGPMGGLGAGVIAGVNPQINVTVELDGQTVGGAIKDSQINESLSGSFNQVNRRGRFAEQAVI
jgi:hypothetical protein